MHVGDLADVSDGSNAERKVKAKIARTAGQLDPRTRTLFTEIEVDNTDHFLVPGKFANVTLHVPQRSYPEIPVVGLIVRGDKTFVADDGLVHMRPVTVASTDGMRAMLAERAKLGDKIAANLPDEVSDGGRIQPVASG